MAIHVSLLFLNSSLLLLPPNLTSNSKTQTKPSSSTTRFSSTTIQASVHKDPSWSLSDGNISNPNPKIPPSDAVARRLINEKARHLSQLRRTQRSHASTPRWIKRTPEQMVQYLSDDRKGHLYGKHVVAAIKTIRGLAGKKDSDRDVRSLMAGFVGRLSFQEMCVVLKEQKGWREARDFFHWMQLQLSYHPSVVVYTIVLRIYGQVGRIKLAEQTFLEMLEAGCEPDEIACGTMLCSYARWGNHKAMFSFYNALEGRGIRLPITVYNFMLSSLQKKSLHENVIHLWQDMVSQSVLPTAFTFTLVISSLVKDGHHEEAFGAFVEMNNQGHLPDEATYSLLISSSTRRGNWDEALKLYDDMRSRGHFPSNFTCASLLTLYYKTADYPKALSLFSEMQRRRINPDEVIYGLLIRIYGKLGRYEDAMRTFQEMENRGLLSSEKTYLGMAQVHLSFRQTERALSIVEEMKSRNIWVSRFGYIVLLQCYVRKGDVNAAEDAFQALSMTGLPDARSCNDMLSLYTRLGFTGKAKDFVLRLRKDEVVFDDEMTTRVGKLFGEMDMPGDAKQLMEEIKGERR
ncbi:Pentatricopeptide repeat-containing protein At5g27270 [Linum grandiflorum]